MKRYFDTVIIGLGLFFLGFGCFLVWERLSPRSLVLATSSDPAQPMPISLTIPSLGINLPIFPAKIVGNKWETTKEGLSYLSSSPLPGNLGNSVIYGHNWSNLLGNLDQVKPGDEIIITSSDTNTYRYLVHFVSVVTPDESHIYSNTPDYRLTLYTCTGFLDSKRLVLTAILE